MALALPLSREPIARATEAGMCGVPSGGLAEPNQSSMIFSGSRRTGLPLRSGRIIGTRRL